MTMAGDKDFDPTTVAVRDAATVMLVRDAGEGNVGARNVHHVVGRRWGAVTFLGDAAKGPLETACKQALDASKNAMASMCPDVSWE